jgi:hypothetical protein
MHYTIWISTPTGRRLAVLHEFVQLDYRRVVNHSGYYDALNVRNILPLRLTVRADAFPPNLIERDTRLQLWRTRPTSGTLHAQQLVTETTWFVRQIRSLLTADGQHLIEIGAVPAIDLLASRIVAYAAGSSQASKHGPADDIMKAIVRENLGNSATDPQRSLRDWLTIAVDRAQAPVLRKSFARRTVLDVLAELAAAATAAGTPLYFDIVNATPTRLEFRTYIGARGADRTFPSGVQPVVLSPETGTLTSVERSFDFEDEYSVVYAAGQGAEAERQVVAASDATRTNGSPFGRRERLIDARHIRDTGALLAEARAALVAGQPRRTFRATIVSTPGATYGQHWDWGDRVTAVFDGEQFHCVVDELEISVTPGRETIRAHLRTDDAVSPVVPRFQQLTSAVETEVIYQQVQRAALPAASTLALPTGGQLLGYGSYTIAGRLDLGTGSRLVILT